jgi:hypothetical protein
MPQSRHSRRRKSSRKSRKSRKKIGGKARQSRTRNISAQQRKSRGSRKKATAAQPRKRRESRREPVISAQRLAAIATSDFAPHVAATLPRRQLQEPSSRSLTDLEIMARKKGIPVAGLSPDAILHRLHEYKT